MLYQFSSLGLLFPWKYQLNLKCNYDHCLQIYVLVPEIFKSEKCVKYANSTSSILVNLQQKPLKLGRQMAAKACSYGNPLFPSSLHWLVILSSKNIKQRHVPDLTFLFDLVKCNLTKLTTTSLAVKRSTSLAVKRSTSLAVKRSTSLVGAQQESSGHLWDYKCRLTWYVVALYIAPIREFIIERHLVHSPRLWIPRSLRHSQSICGGSWLCSSPV